MSKSTGQVNLTNKTSGDYISTKDLASKNSDHHNSTKNLTTDGQAKGQKPVTAVQSPTKPTLAKKNYANPDSVKARLKIPKSVEKPAKTVSPSVMTPPPLKVHREVHRGNAEVRVADEGFPSSPSTTPNSQVSEYIF